MPVSLPRILRHSTVVRDDKGKVVRTAVLASAVLVRQSELRQVKTQNWQKEAWDFYDQVPELHYAGLWRSNCLSRCRLFVAEIPDDADSPPVPVDDERLRAPMEEFFAGPAGQAEMLRRIGVHLTIAGETYLVGTDTPTGRYWAVASTDEVESTGGSTAKVRSSDTGEPIELGEQSMVMRLWYPHARQAWVADSSIRSLASSLRELLGLSMRTTADIESRLAGAGLLVIPDSATLPAPATTDGANPLHADPLIATLIESMVTPISDRDSAAAVVPIVLRVPDAAVDAVKHLTFATPLDENLIAMRDSAISRVATGVDMPHEVLMGLGDANHWNAWQIDENGVKAHIEPTLVMVCDALTQRFLRPVYTRDAITSEPGRYCVWFDTGDLTERSNRGPEALQLYEAGLLSADACRREHGFGDSDAPSVAEATARLAVKLATTNPELAVQLWQMLAPGNPVATPIEVSGGAPSTPGSGAPPAPTPGTGEAPGGGTPPGPPAGTPPGTGPRPPGTPAAVRDGFVAAVEMGVLRALERAGNRLLATDRAYRGRYAQVPAWRLHEHIPAQHIDPLLEDAYSSLKQVLPEHPCVVRTVDRYVRRLIRDQAPHERDQLARELARFGCTPGVGRG